MKLVPKLLPALVLGGAGALVMGIPANAASVSPMTAHAHPVPRTVTPRTATLFPVFGTELAVPAQTQVRVTANCPKGTVPFGGGVFTGSSSILVNVNDSFPSGTGWIGDVNNASAETRTPASPSCVVTSPRTTRS